MISIESVASYVPPVSVDVFERAKKVGADLDFVRSKLGTERLRQMETGEDTSDLAVAAIQALLEKTDQNPAKIDCLVVCTQNPDGTGLPHVAALVQHKAGLPVSTAAFDISLGCSGFVYGVKVSTGFMQASGLHRGILVTADPYSKIVDPADRETALLFGDCATATLLGPNGEWVPGRALWGTDGSRAKHLENRNGVLHMNGRQVFNYVMTQIPDQVHTLLELENLTIDDVDRFLFHQGSRYIVEQLAIRLGVPQDKVPVRIAETGNTVSSSVPLILEEFMQNRTVKKMVLSGFGVGFSAGTLLLERQKG